jgi:hypothetical protein
VPTRDSKHAGDDDSCARCCRATELSARFDCNSGSEFESAAFRSANVSSNLVEGNGDFLSVCSDTPLVLQLSRRRRRLPSWDVSSLVRSRWGVFLLAELESDAIAAEPRGATAAAAARPSSASKKRSSWSSWSPSVLL